MDTCRKKWWKLKKFVLLFRACPFDALTHSLYISFPFFNPFHFVLFEFMNNLFSLIWWTKRTTASQKNMFEFTRATYLPSDRTKWKEKNLNWRWKNENRKRESSKKSKHSWPSANYFCYVFINHTDEILHVYKVHTFTIGDVMRKFQSRLCRFVKIAKL